MARSIIMHHQYTKARQRWVQCTAFAINAFFLKATERIQGNMSTLSEKLSSSDSPMLTKETSCSRKPLACRTRAPLSECSSRKPLLVAARTQDIWQQERATLWMLEGTTLGWQVNKKNWCPCSECRAFFVVSSRWTPCAALEANLASQMRPGASRRSSWHRASAAVAVRPFHSHTHGPSMSLLKC